MANTPVYAYPGTDIDQFPLTIEGHSPNESEEILYSLADQIDKILLISCLEFNFRLQHFKNILATMGKPLDVWLLHKYNHFTKRQIIIRFNTLAEKRHFMHVFRNVFPEFHIQEIFDQIRVLNIHDEINLKALTDLMQPVDLKESFGEEFLMGDFKLAKDPAY